MESTNLHHQHHHHQLQEHHLVGSSPLAAPSCYAVGSTTHAWSTPNTILNHSPCNFIPNNNGNGGGVIMNSGDDTLREQNYFLAPSSNCLMIQNLGFQSNSHDLHLARINHGELPSSIENKYFHSQPTSYVKNEHRDHLRDDLNEKHMLGNLSSSCQVNGLNQITARESMYSGAMPTPGRGNFSQILPTINISNMNQASSGISNISLDKMNIMDMSMNMNMHVQGLDLFTSGRFSSSVHDDIGLYKDILSYDLDHMQQSSHRLSYSPSKIPAGLASGVTEAKRGSSFLEQKAVPSSHAPPQKKSKSDSRASCPPFKVRKEKLGDRIASLQQLVAPFGKTDTASVLMEAIGYIKFLQNQVETLSVPYMKSSRNKAARTTRGGTTASEDGDGEPKRDLRSRGLCLVPLSCMSYVTDDGGGGVWPPPSFSSDT